MKQVRMEATMQRVGLVNISSMFAFGTAPKAQPLDHAAAPWNTHWSQSCVHDLVPRLKQYPSGMRAKMQCRKCGQGVGPNVAMRGVTEVWDEELEVRVSREYQSLCDEYRQRAANSSCELRGERSREWWEMYGRYLESPVWHTKRLLVLERCGGICECCGQADAQQVHHLKYPEVFGLEPLWDLRAVCIPCHKIIHPHMR